MISRCVTNHREKMRESGFTGMDMFLERYPSLVQKLLIIWKSMASNHVGDQSRDGTTAIDSLQPVDADDWAKWCSRNQRVDPAAKGKCQEGEKRTWPDLIGAPTFKTRAAMPVSCRSPWLNLHPSMNLSIPETSKLQPTLFWISCPGTVLYVQCHSQLSSHLIIPQPKVGSTSNVSVSAWHKAVQWLDEMKGGQRTASAMPIYLEHSRLNFEDHWSKPLQPSPCLVVWSPARYTSSESSAIGFEDDQEF